jgi:threonine/homoserine/homoserine lactone efflux protein
LALLVTFEAFFAFAFLNFAYSLAPGPNAALIVGTSARGGTKAGLGVILGILIAEIIWALVAIAVVVGLLDLMHFRPDTLKTLGACALVLIGTMMLIARAPQPVPASGVSPDAPDPVLGALSQTVMKGGFVGLTNPLALVFFISIAPSFLKPSQITQSTAIIFAAAAVFSCAAAHLPYLGAARLSRSRFGHLVERGCGVALCCLGATAVANSGLISL